MSSASIPSGLTGATAGAAAASPQQAMPALSVAQGNIKALIVKTQALADKAIACNADFSRIYNAFTAYWNEANDPSLFPNPGLRYYTIHYYPYQAHIYYGGSPRERNICNLLKKDDAIALKNEMDKSLHAKVPALLEEYEQIRSEFDKLAKKERLLLLDPESHQTFNKLSSVAYSNLRFYQDVKGSFHVDQEGRVSVSEIVKLQEEINFAIAGQRPLPPAPGPNDWYSLKPSGGCTIM